jgi:hypothetical protein
MSKNSKKTPLTGDINVMLDLYQPFFTKITVKKPF